MPVSFKYNLLFVHIPKNAGTSIRFSLADLDPEIVRWAYHNSIQNYQNVVNPQIFAKLFKFAFVRNPWDHVISAYFYMTKENFFQGTLENFINQHIFGQLHWIKLNGKIAVDFIGQVEHFERDLKELSRRANLPPIPYRQLKVIERDHYSVYYDENTIEMVAEKHREEIEMFNYTFKSKYIRSRPLLLL